MYELNPVRESYDGTGSAVYFVQKLIRQIEFYNDSDSTMWLTFIGATFTTTIKFLGGDYAEHSFPEFNQIQITDVHGDYSLKEDK